MGAITKDKYGMHGIADWPEEFQNLSARMDALAPPPKQVPPVDINTLDWENPTPAIPEVPSVMGQEKEKAMEETTITYDAESIAKGWDSIRQRPRGNTAAAKLVKVMGRVGYVQKDKKNSHFKYNYLSEEAVKREIQAACVAENLALEVSVEILDGGLNHLIIKAQVEFIDPDTGHSVISEGVGQGKDNTDKAAMKAQTAAVREAMKNACCIPAGNDPEGDDSVDSPAKAPSKPRKAGKVQPPSDTPVMTPAALQKALEALGKDISGSQDLQVLRALGARLSGCKASSGQDTKSLTMYESMVKHYKTKEMELK